MATGIAVALYVLGGFVVAVLVGVGREAGAIKATRFAVAWCALVWPLFAVVLALGFTASFFFDE